MRFIHAADLHLGMIPDAQHPWGRERANALFYSAEKIVDLVLQENVDALFLMGQIFHLPPLQKDLEYLHKLFQKIPFCHVFLFCKKTEENYFLRSFSFSENVHVFTEEQSKFYLPEPEMEILAMQEKDFSFSAAESFSLEHGDAIPILLWNERKAEEFLSLEKTQNSENAIAAKESPLASLPFSYIALGGESKRSVFANGKAAFPGSPEPLSAENTGEHGVYLGSIHPITKRLESLSFFPISTLQYISLYLQLDPSVGQEALKQGLLKKIEERGKQNIYKIRFSGKRDPETKVDPSLFPKELRIVECLDETLPQYDFYALYKEHQQDILGFFIRSYLKKDLEDLSSMEKQSLFYGVSALLEGGKS